MAKFVKGGMLAGVALFVLLIIRAQPVSAGSGCIDMYTVQRGDTLGRIAQQFGLSLSDLWAANRDRIANPDRIYVGQRICLPAGGDSKAAPAPAASQVVLEAWYRYALSDDEDRLELPRSGELGKRVALQLLPMQPAVVFTGTREITQALLSSVDPVFVGLRNRDADGQHDLTYTLVAIGSGDIFARLAISGALSITPSVSPGQARAVTAFLQQSDVEEAGLYLWLEAEDGVRMPFYVSALDVAPDKTRFSQWYLDPQPGDRAAWVRADDIGFALFPAGPDQYQMMLRLSSDGYGPPQWTTKTRCDAWHGRRGFWFWFFRLWYRCPA